MIAPVREWPEADMARHMLLEMPIVFALGAMAAREAPAAGRALGPLDRHGLVGWLAASLVTAYWMLPVALDAALGSVAVNGAKFASLAFAGFALASSCRRSPPIGEAFFVGNFAWMAATVGLLYQEAPSQLCLNYLGRQPATGRPGAGRHGDRRGARMARGATSSPGARGRRGELTSYPFI